MPLVEPSPLREKLLLIGGAGAGKTTAHLSIAWWAHVSGDTRKFFIADTDDEAVLQVMDEPKYEGMLHSVDGEIVNEGGNVIITSTRNWDAMVAWKNMVMGPGGAKKGDWVVFDFITEFWVGAQEGYLQDAANKTRGEVLYDAGIKGASGWDMYKEEFNWPAINGSYFDVVKTILVSSRAHIFMTAEEALINENKPTPDEKEHLAQFGKYKAVGQKKLPYQCRSYLRTQRLARGRVLYTMGKDRARQEFTGETITDFFTDYLKHEKAGRWTVTDPA